MYCYFIHFLGVFFFHVQFLFGSILLWKWAAGTSGGNSWVRDAASPASREFSERKRRRKKDSSAPVSFQSSWKEKQLDVSSASSGLVFGRSGLGHVDLTEFHGGRRKEKEIKISFFFVFFLSWECRSTETSGNTQGFISVRIALLAAGCEFGNFSPAGVYLKRILWDTGRIQR